MLALALRSRSSYLTPIKCPKGLPNKREADSMDDEGCFKNLVWDVGEQQKVSTSSLPICVAVIALGRYWPSSDTFADT